VAAAPDVLFHRYFQQLPAYRRAIYRGKQQLDAIERPLQDLLRALQANLNEALQNERQDVPEHVAHPPFHMDFIDSDDAKALARRPHHRPEHPLSTIRGGPEKEPQKLPLPSWHHPAYHSDCDRRWCDSTSGVRRVGVLRPQYSSLADARPHEGPRRLVVPAALRGLLGQDLG